MAVLFLVAFDKNSLAEHTEIAEVGDDRTDIRVRRRAEPANSSLTRLSRSGAAKYDLDSHLFLYSAFSACSARTFRSEESPVKSLYWLTSTAKGN